ncbi:MAG: GyrI-like domain-containing protein [Candidatus Thermoplasmatota archaeon]|nr:GyrI-like domain-containing protein [Candidatus Thermoplasmatota archaeon]
MEHEIVEKEKMKLIGLNYHGSITENGVAFEESVEDLWRRLSEFCMNSWDSIEKGVINPELSYEIQIWNEEELDETGRMSVFVGIEYKDFDSIPVQLGGKILPGGKYLSFTFEGEEINGWEEYLLQEWFPESDYWLRPFDGQVFHIQCFHEDKFKGVENIEESELKVLVPVEKIDQEIMEE